jgi:predicted Zn-dependent peptidase
MNIQETKLSNNIRVLTNKMDTQTAAIGAFVDAGARHETIENNGVAHFLEHLSFKKTETRTAYQISQEIEVQGSYVNAMTSHESTAYYSKGLAENIETPTNIIGDVLTNSKYDDSDIRLESGVILQEISQYEDDPGSTMQDLLKRVSYPNQPVGRAILGTKEFVSNAKTSDFRNFVDTHYSGENMLVIASGGVEHGRIVELVDKAFNKLPATTVRPPREGANYVGGIAIENKKPFTQVSAGISWHSVPAIDNAMYAHMLLSNAFGGGMSSPLFTEVREKRGLVYHVSAYADFNIDHGDFMIFGGTTPENLNEFINVACSEFAKCVEHIDELDLIRSKNKVLVSLAMVQEKSESMMHYMARSISVHNRIRNFDEIKKEIERITIKDLKKAAKNLLKSKPAISLVGPVPEADYEGMVKAAVGA